MLAQSSIRKGSCAVFAAALVFVGLGVAEAKPQYPGEFTSDADVAKLRKEVGAKTVPIEHVDALKKTKAKLAAVAGGKGNVRILQLGDSHIASDYITGRIRQRLQEKYGAPGRGFVHVDQAWGYGGRRLKKRKSDWEQDRIVDKNRAGRPFGFSGLSLESKKKGAWITYRTDPADAVVRVYYYAQKDGAKLSATLDGHDVGSHSTAAERPHSGVWSIDLSKVPPAEKPAKMRGPDGGRILKITADGPKARMFGLSFEHKKPGVFYESIGPVGADAKVYIELGRESLEQHLGTHRPDLVVLMVGGNDALKIRKKWTNQERVEKDHVVLVELLRQILPDVEILMWAPMDAGDRRNGKVVSKAYLAEVRALQRRVATDKEIAFWDTIEAMGGLGAITRWDAAKVMNKDLVHPKKAAADLLGDLFADAFLAAMK